MNISKLDTRNEQYIVHTHASRTDRVSHLDPFFLDFQRTYSHNHCIVPNPDKHLYVCIRINATSHSFMLLVTRNLAGIGVKLVRARKIRCWMVLTARNERRTRGMKLRTHDIPLMRRARRTRVHGQYLPSLRNLVLTLGGRRTVHYLQQAWAKSEGNVNRMTAYPISPEPRSRHRYGHPWMERPQSRAPLLQIENVQMFSPWFALL